MRTLFIGLSALCLLALGVQSQDDITFTPLAPVGVEGQNIIFTCSLPGGQVPNLERMLPDGSFPIINTDPRVSVVVNQNVNVVFTIQNLNSSQDNGSVWRCSLGALTSPVATLTVQIPVRYDFVSNVTRDVVEGNNVMIDFGLTAFPTPSVTFYFNGSMLQSGGGITFDAGSITFSPVARTHAGEYLLDANNVAGNATLCFILNVQYQPAFEPFTDGALGMIVCVLDETTAEINCAVRTTQGGMLTCLADGRPTPTISGSPALANNQFVVTNAEAADAGTYSCNATNSVATVPRVYNLEVGDVPNGVDGLAFETSVETIGQQISVTVTFDFTDDSGVRIQYFRLEVVDQTFSRTITRPEGTSVSDDLTIEEEDLAPGTYTVVVRAVNLLGDGEAREAMLEVNFNGAIAVASVSFLLTAVLMLFSVLLLN